MFVSSQLNFQKSIVSRSPLEPSAGSALQTTSRNPVAPSPCSAAFRSDIREPQAEHRLGATATLLEAQLDASADGAGKVNAATHFRTGTRIHRQVG